MVIRIEHASEAAAPEGAKKLFIKSYGCQMNVYDAMRMGELMKPHGYALVDCPDDADLIVLNTCHIREKADDKLFSDIGRHKARAAKGAMIAVGGCVGQAMGEKIMRRAPSVSIVFGPQTFHRLPEFVASARQTESFKPAARVVDTAFPALEKFDHLPQPGAYGPTAFVSIQEGCDKFCTYCVVPYTRGAELSRPMADVVNEVQGLVDQGVREVTLLGQNVNAYHGEDAAGQEVSFAGLLTRLAAMDGLQRIRFTTSHPNNMDDGLIGLYSSEPKLMPYLHLPVQAGSNRILAAMNRNHTAESYIEIIDTLRAARPDVALAGDFIVGFPGETEEDYQQTLEIVARVGYAQAYSFAYSPRPGTPAAALDGQVDKATKMERLAGLQALLIAQQEDFNRQFVGQTLEVLVEELGRDNQVRGRTPHNVAVNIPVAGASQEDLIGQIVRVNIAEAYPRSLLGTLVN